MSSEFDRIAQLATLLHRPSPDVMLGIGDDCAVLAPSGHVRVWTVDAAVENVHFARTFMRLEDIAYRAFMAATSDIAAMGGRAVAALSALTLPSTLRDEELGALGAGLARAADACACPIVGGNLARGGELSLTTSVLGECKERVLTRDGAHVGDGIFVTGTLGGAALGLRALQRGLHEEAVLAGSIRRFLAPTARLDLAAAVAQVASAAVDVSDGLLQDLGHLCRASKVGAQIELAALPLLPGFVEAARALDLEPHELALSGGEDYELLFTAPRTAVDPALATWIGVVTDEDAQLTVLELGGARRKQSAHGGFDHFAER